MWASTCEVGCAIAHCPYLLQDEHFSYYYEYANPGREYIPFLVVCNYGPGPSGYQHRPYTQGKPCTRCPDDYPLCDIPPSPYHAAGEQDNNRIPGLCCKLILFLV